MTSQPKSLFVFGLGYSARVLACRLERRGWTVAGTTRSETTAAALREAGFATHLFDRGRQLHDPSAALAATHLVISVPPDSEGDPVLDRHADDIASCHGLEWVGYLSTTGVYGDREGGWVDESSDLRPTSERSRRRVDAERRWLDLWRGRGLPVHLFRLAGIYGPGRSVLDAVRAGTAKRIDKPGQVFSRIHVEDIATVLEASMAHPNPGCIYNVCDDDPAPPAEVVDYACRLLGVPPPPLVPFDEANLSPMAHSFYRDNRRVSNRRIKEELRVRLAYPDYKRGLKALLASGVLDQTPRELNRRGIPKRV